MGALAAFVLVNQHDLVPIFFRTHNITELVLLIQVMFLALVAADCEWKEKEITVQEGEAVRLIMLTMMLRMFKFVFQSQG